MSNNVKIELNTSGVKAILQSQEVADALVTEAGKIAMRSGGTVGSTYIRNNRQNVYVRSDNRDNSLLKSMR